MNKIKFEKINMKIVIGIGAVIIAFLTVCFIIFKTNLIIKCKEEDKVKKPTTEQVQDNSSEEEPSEEVDDEFEEEESTESLPEEEPEEEEPIYEDPEEEVEGQVSTSVKKRTKKQSELTSDEKKYIIQENLDKAIKKEKGMKTACTDNSLCAVDIKKYLTYSTKETVGKKITGCSGNVVFFYEPAIKQFIYDMQDVKCK